MSQATYEDPLTSPEATETKGGTEEATGGRKRRRSKKAKGKKRKSSKRVKSRKVGKKSRKRRR